MKVAVKELNNFNNIDDLIKYIKDNNKSGEHRGNIVSLNKDGHIAIETYEVHGGYEGKYRATYDMLFKESPLSNLDNNISLHYNNNIVFGFFKESNNDALAISCGLDEFDSISELIDNIYYLFSAKHDVRIYFKWETSNFYQGIMLSYFYPHDVEEHRAYKFICNDALHDKYNK